MNNEVDVIYPDNTIEKALVGTDAEMLADSRQFETKTFSGGIQFNLDIFRIGPFPIPIPTGIPTIDREITNFQSGVNVRVINKYGILKTTTAYEEGASLKTENLIFDSETGEVLLTKTQNEFDDYIYNTTYPSHWVYDNMGPASINEGAVFEIVKCTDTERSFKVKVNGTDYAPENYLAQGDILEVKNGSESIATNGVWVHKTDGGNWRLMDIDGNLITLLTSTVYTARVIRSGRKNMQALPIATISSLKLPVDDNQLVHDDEILNVSVQEYDNKGTIPGCYNEGTVSTFVDLFDEAIDLFNYFVQCGTISIVNASDYNYASPYPEPWNYYSGTTYTVDVNPFDTLCNDDETFNNSIFKSIANKYGHSGPYSVKRTQFRRYGFTTGTTPAYSHYGFGYVLFNDIAPLNFSNANGTDTLFIQVSIAFDEGNSTIRTTLDSHELESLEVDIEPGDISVIPYGAWYEPTRMRLLATNKATLHFAGGITHTATADIVASLKSTKPSTGVDLKKLNPYTNGLRNQWKPKRNWAYLEKRIPETTASNIRKDGTFKTFNNFWSFDNSKWVKASTLTNWQFTKEVTKYAPNGTEIESRNPLNQYNAVLLGNQHQLPVAVANNSKYTQLFNENFEYTPYYYNPNSDYVSCPTGHGMTEALSTKLDTNFAHTGKNCYKVTSTTRLLSTFSNFTDHSYATGTSDYTTDTGDYTGIFLPEPGTYVLSAWVKVANTFVPLDYSQASVLVTASTNAPIDDSGPSGYNTQTYMRSTGPIIEGWQRIEGVFTVISGTKRVSVKLIPYSGQTTYFDDIRIHPKDAVMKSYVYDPITLKLVCELDENNYATFYEYDKSGNLIRVKKETEGGIVTLKESRSSLPKD